MTRTSPIRLPRPQSGAPPLATVAWSIPAVAVALAAPEPASVFDVASDRATDARRATTIGRFRERAGLVSPDSIALGRFRIAYAEGFERRSEEWRGHAFALTVMIAYTGGDPSFTFEGWSLAPGTSWTASFAPTGIRLSTIARIPGRDQAEIDADALDLRCDAPHVRPGVDTISVEARAVDLDGPFRIEGVTGSIPPFSAVAGPETSA